ncbi:MAG: phosphoenolpyruvate--protein phosphotransferase [Desulfuromonadaceae bacterium]|nr:phosphoenolpyruvate--protein phosphotransferase [Desulfuromonadaceae bacterium]
MKGLKKRFGIATLEDISGLILNSHDLDQTLNNIVRLVARRIGTEVCSIYLLEKPEGLLRLKATKGLSKRAVGKVILKVGEGLTGLVVEKRHVVTSREPEKDPRNRYFPETREELFHSFLGIPLFDRREPIGALVVQTRAPREFNEDEIGTLSTIAFQVSSIIVNARLLDSIRRQEIDREATAGDIAVGDVAAELPEALERPRALNGISAHPGVASGPALVVTDQFSSVDFYAERPVLVETELERMKTAVEQVRVKTLFLEKRVAERLGARDAAIFNTHLMILEDRGFLEKWQQEITDGAGVVGSLRKVVGEYVAAFERMNDPYLRDRAGDVRDIGRRLLSVLLGTGEPTIIPKGPVILICREVHPSDLAAIDPRRVRGIAAEEGGENSHAVIMAKSMGIPMVIGLTGLMHAVAGNDFLILDADSGCLHINPGGKLISQYRRLEESSSKEVSRLEEWRHLPALSSDRKKVTLRANIGPMSDVDIALRNGAEGVGLFRTEFHYMVSPGFPSRDEQYRFYRHVVERFGGCPVTIRTFDLGGDKVLPYFPQPLEKNPFMGWRSLRISLDHQDIFLTQLEAILMAAVHGPVNILFPLVSGLEEIRLCRELMEEARRRLRREGLRCAGEIPCGAMIEIPAAVRMVSHLAREVDFFCLGTNDLIQYMLAADRGNPLVRRFYDPLHPAVLQVVKDVREETGRAGKCLCLCGEMASDPLCFLALFGLGIREFSMPSPFIPRIKAFLSRISSGQGERIGERILAMGTSSEIRHFLQENIPPS